MDEAERRIEQLIELRRAGQVSTTCCAEVVFLLNSKNFCQKWSMQESVKSAVNLTKSLEGTCAQLQAELRNTDAENNRLTVQLQVHRPQGKAY